jgi:hypothetical protein
MDTTAELVECFKVGVVSNQEHSIAIALHSCLEIVKAIIHNQTHMAVANTHPFVD